MTKSFFGAMLALSILSLFTCQDVFAKEWTIEERQEQLMQDVNSAQKSSQLTVKEARGLRSRLAAVAKKKAKMKTKIKNEQLTAEDKTELETSLNEISVDIKRLQLEKRTETKTDDAKSKSEESKSETKKEDKKDGTGVKDKIKNLFRKGD